jgi:subtilisin family serine protease
LDRIDQRDIPLNQQYEYNYTGENVTAYVIDTGIRASHEEFDNGRAVCNKSAIADEVCEDGNGHGTHVAATIGGRTYGVAKKVAIVGVKVLSNSGEGSSSAVIDGINHVLESCVKSDSSNSEEGTKRCIVNMSLGGGESASIDAAVQDLIDAGIFVAVAAGNSNIDACLGSPARVTQAVTVASTTKDDERSSFSNWGT